MDWHYVNTLLAIGFSRQTAEKIARGRETEALPEEEVLQFAHAWENDKVDMMKPLVEKYGWEGLFERLEESVEQRDE